MLPNTSPPGLLIAFLLDNDLAQKIEIQSKEYGIKNRYITGNLTLLPFACSFYKRSYVSHATALYVHNLAPEGRIYINHEQSPKKTTSRLSQVRIDQAFKNRPRRSSYEFRTETHIFVFLNGKNTGDAGVVEIVDPSGQSIRCTSLERTLIDCVVRPQYVEGIATLASVLPKAIDRISTQELLNSRCLRSENQELGYPILVCYQAWKVKKTAATRHTPAAAWFQRRCRLK